MMKRIVAVAGLTTLLLVGGARKADAGVSIGIGIPGIVFGAPIYAGPAYYPPPYYGYAYGVPPYYGPAYYYGPPIGGGVYFGGRFGHGGYHHFRGRGWGGGRRGWHR